MTTTQLLTETEVAEMMKISPRTLQHWRVAGGGPTYMKFGHSVRYDRATLDNWLASRSVANTSATAGAAHAAAGR